MEVASPRARVQKMAIRRVDFTASSKTENTLQIRGTYRTHSRFMANVTYSRVIQGKSETQAFAK